MPGLVDIVPLRKTVYFERGDTRIPITVRGISITVIGQCLAESEDLQRFWAGRKFDAVSLLAAIPRTISRIVATALVEDDPATEVLAGFSEEHDGSNGAETPTLTARITARMAEAATRAASERERQISLNMIAFDELNGDDQLTLVEAVVSVSFPGGLSPFVDRLGMLAGRDNLTGTLRARYGKAPDTSSPPQ
jgi:hypothetical protein